jgi:hypothetical protein
MSMRIAVFAGLLIVFISIFFILFIMSVAIRPSMECIFTVTDSCDYGKAGSSFAVGLSFIAFFVLIDIIVFYLMTSRAESEFSVF